MSADSLDADAIHQPRIAPLPRDEWTDEVGQAIAALMPAGAQRPLRRK